MSELNFDLALSQQFLGDLARNNNLDWMHAHQTEYKLARKQFEDLALSLIHIFVIGWISYFSVKRPAPSPHYARTSHAAAWPE